ncbi:DUF2868 domain-containing protein [Pseudomaricurvus alcaniphilus]|uniref:DUF2868 domain-containing protein n=1 Tax=Pseudomaricurvus alcaniphilus TaxID=1166482 RepID=UPI00140B5C8B|nr:DUF2868 domain-containing protein [Pseudomaricurvus alcaniphilus]NHN36159.1 DUF2868 domain-containing protein [Pseudomaricurvus alcaniphilus]
MPNKKTQQSSRSAGALLADLIDLSLVLDSDQEVDLEERKRRDRAAGRRLECWRNKPVAQVRAWLHESRPKAAGNYGQQGVRVYHGLNVGLLVAGLLSGWGLASAVLYYDGQQPINIVNAVAVLVLPQILLLLLWLVAALPARLSLFRQLGTGLGFLNPGRLAGHLVGVFTSKPEQGLAMLWQSDNAPILGPATRWLLSLWSQLFAVSFNIGVLVSALFLVSFSDLAFAWSTTLVVTSETFHQLLVTLSAPWSSLLPDAVPGAELVAQSRYYRLDEGALADPAATPELAIALGQWWPFLIAAVAFYGLLPRLLTLTISWYRLRHHLGRALCKLPGAPELLARMNSPLVSTAAAEPEHAFTLAPGSAARNSAAAHYALRCPVIDWSAAGSAAGDAGDVSSALAAMGVEPLEFLRAGGRQTLEQDQQMLAALARDKPAALALLVKAWEPPMLDLLDFLRDIRQQLGEEKPLLVLLWGGAEQVSGADRETWQLTLGQLGDPNLHVESLALASRAVEKKGASQ